MCRISTGNTLAKRALYTDADEYAIIACRPQLANGIPDRIAGRPDFLDRAIVLRAPTIPSSARKPEHVVWAEFERDHPCILGALLEGVRAALRDAEGIVVEDPPRLVGFVKRAEAGCRALGFKAGAFTAAYKANRKLAGAAALEDNPAAEAVIIMARSGEAFFGTSTQLLARLEYHTCRDPRLKQSHKWPKSGSRLSSMLRSAARLLREAGVDIRFDQSLSRIDKRGIRISRSPLDQTSPLAD
jgi:hypothetical protein